MAQREAAVVCICGGIGSGKTELARGISTHLELRVASFGDYVRSVAQSRGIPARRELLQQIGQELVERDLRQFCQATLLAAQWSPGKSLVVEGIRHLEAFREIQDIVSPTPAALIYLATPDELRIDRLAASRPSDAENLERHESHATEAQVKTTLKSAANLVLDGSLSVEELTQRLDEWFKHTSLS